MSFDPIHIWATMGLVSRIIAGSLLLMGVLSLTVLVERIFVLWRTVRTSRKFARQAGPLLDQGDYAGVLALAEEKSGSHLAVLVGATLKAYTTHRIGGALTPLERAKRELERTKEEVAGQLRRGLSVLASIGSIAPFVGLLGTVVGIVYAFQSIAASGSGGLSSVSGGISEALVETALGLVVAIPSVLIFNTLSTKADGIESSLQQAGSRLLDTLEDRHHVDVRQQNAA